MTSGNYDIAVVVGQSKLNSLVGNLYKAIYDRYLVGNSIVNTIGISTIDYDLNTAPTITINQGDDSTAEITLSGSIYVGINYQNGAKSTQVTANMTVTANGTLTDHVIVTIKTASCSIPSSPLMQELVNNALLPSMVLRTDGPVNHLITGSLSSIAIGNVNLPGLTFMPPKISSISGYFLCYTALASTFSPPPAAGLPTDKIFAIISTSAISKLANANLKTLAGGGAQVFYLVGGPHTWIHVSKTVSASYTVTPSNIVVSVAGSNMIKIMGHVSATGNVTATGYFQDDVNAQGDITAEGSFSIDNKGNLNVKVSFGIENLSVNITERGLIAHIIGALADWLKPLIIGTAVLDLQNVSLNFPQVIQTQISVGELPFSITLSGFSYGGFDSNQSLLVTADVNLS